MKKQIHNVLFATLLGLAPVSCFGSESEVESRFAELRQKEKDNPWRTMLGGLALFAVSILQSDVAEAEEIRAQAVNDCPDYLREEARKFLDSLERWDCDDDERNEMEQHYIAVLRVLANEELMCSQRPEVVAILQCERDWLTRKLYGSEEVPEIVLGGGPRSKDECELRAMIEDIPLLVAIVRLYLRKEVDVKIFVQEVTHRLEQRKDKKDDTSLIYRMLLLFCKMDGKLGFLEND